MNNFNEKIEPDWCYEEIPKKEIEEDFDLYIADINHEEKMLED